MKIKEEKKIKEEEEILNQQENSSSNDISPPKANIYYVFSCAYSIMDTLEGIHLLQKQQQQVHLVLYNHNSLNVHLNFGAIVSTTAHQKYKARNYKHVLEQSTAV